MPTGHLSLITLRKEDITKRNEVGLFSATCSYKYKPWRYVQGRPIQINEDYINAHLVNKGNPKAKIANVKEYSVPPNFPAKGK